MAPVRERPRAEAEAFARVISPLLTPAYRLAFGLTLDPRAAEHAVVRAAAKAYRAHGQLRPGASLWRWFASIVRREVRSVDPPAQGTLPLTAHEPELRRLRRLTFDDRSVLLLHYYVDLSMEELAAAERLSKVEIRARLALARERVRPLLTEADFVGQLDDSSLAHRLRALVGGLGDPGPDFQVVVETAIASGLLRNSFQRPLLAIFAAVLLLALIPMAPGALRYVRALPFRPVAASAPRVVVTPSMPAHPSIELPATVSPTSEQAPTQPPVQSQTPVPHTPTPHTPTPNNPPPAVALTDPGLPQGEVGVGYPTTTWTASAGTPPYHWAVSGDTFGLSVSQGSSTLTVAGTPSGSGASTFTVTVTDNRNQTQSRSRNLTISPHVAVSGPSGGNGGHGEVGVAMPDVVFTTSQGLGARHLVSINGTVPAGLGSSFDGTTVRFAGTPSGAGPFSFTVTVGDDAGATAVSPAFAGTIEAALTIPTDPTLPAGQEGTAYPGASITASGGVAPYSWVGVGPVGTSGLTANEVGDGTVSVTGAAPVAGDYAFSLTVKDGCAGCQGQASKTFTVHIAPSPPPATP